MSKIFKISSKHENLSEAGIYKFFAIGGALSTVFALYKEQTDWAVVAGAVTVAGAYLSYSALKAALMQSNDDFDGREFDRRIDDIWRQMDSLREDVDKKVYNRDLDDSLSGLYREQDAIYSYIEEKTDGINRRIDDESRELYQAIGGVYESVANDKEDF